MSKELQEFEQNLLQLIQNPPQLKYQQWQQVPQGRIVGFYFDLRCSKAVRFLHLGNDEAVKPE